ncbi:hypothetical protein [Parendozoicomonas haliclonae]|uniref:Tetratricopeptide repeat protein n=1 Tax=Parendozoicomonas haliclonae TaxID=1960125 RepID=A0A1X7ANN5_9GAMM|nr:hypothetical protein [Parendozoicomonas haliclonae]SMA49896.1 Tetratricopeptide repeat protein [Parendozoicomonas haliclonae]
MTTEIPVSLDHEELLHCAILAGEQSQHDRALTLLKQAQALNNNTQTVLLIAAQHAELRLYDRALAGMEQALELDPQLWIARFQLAQLLITMDNEQGAVAQWQLLLTSEAPDYLKQFAQGLLAAQQQNPAQAVTYLQQGLALNKENAPLNNDMQQVIHYLEQRSGLGASQQATYTQSADQKAPLNNTTEEQIKAASEDEATGLSKMLLSRYQQS